MQDSVSAYAIGDIVEMKKPHPCGVNRWCVIRSGLDYKIQCTGCGHVVMMPRTAFIKAVKRRIP